jgi:hypothetical protein
MEWDEIRTNLLNSDTSMISANKKLIDFKNHQRCPGINSICYSNGEVQLIDIIVDWKHPVVYEIHLGIKTSIAELERENKLSWNDCVIRDQIITDEPKVEILCGEGNLGADGFIAVINASDKLDWVAFFDCSNPFVKLAFKDGVIYAESSLGHTWKLPLLSPHNLTIERPK